MYVSKLQFLEIEVVHPRNKKQNGLLFWIHDRQRHLFQLIQQVTVPDQVHQVLRKAKPPAIMLDMEAWLHLRCLSLLHVIIALPVLVIVKEFGVDETGPGFSVS
jgi:hypothetical protein